MLTNLFQLGDFTLCSGKNSRWKIECDALTRADWEALALMVYHMSGPFTTVEGVPRGGLILAECLQQYRTYSGAFPQLIVDDVLTTGGSMERLRKKYPDRSVTLGAVIFARGPCPPWIKALFQMPTA